MDRRHCKWYHARCFAEKNLFPASVWAVVVRIRKQRDELTIVRAALKHTTFPKDDMKAHVNMLKRATALADARKGYGKGSGGWGRSPSRPQPQEAPSGVEGRNPVTAATRAQEKWVWHDREPTSTARDEAEGGNPVTAAMP